MGENNDPFIRSILGIRRRETEEGRTILRNEGAGGRYTRQDTLFTIRIFTTPQFTGYALKKPLKG